MKKRDGEKEPKAENNRLKGINNGFIIQYFSSTCRTRNRLNVYYRYRK